MSLTDKLDEQQARLAALKASETELTEGPDAALRVLGPLVDPIRMRAALGILLRANRHQAAADLIRDQRIDDKWIDLAALVFAFLGDIPRALSLVDRADNSPDLPVMRSARLGFAEGVIEQWRTRHPQETLLGIQNWSDADVELAKTVIDILDPLVSSVKANRRIDGDFELSAVICTTYCAHVAQDRAVFLQCIHWLTKHRPVPLLLGELSLRGLVPEPPEGLPNRLRVEHAGEFQAALLAALIERELLGKAQQAFDALVQLSRQPLEEEEKESVSIALFETCARCGLEQIQEAIAAVKALKPRDERLLGLLQGIKHIAAGDIPEAKTQLTAVRDESDGVWWQAQAQLYERTGDEEAAQLAWERASELLPHPDVVRRSIKASLDRRKYQSAVRGLTKLLQGNPDDSQSLKALAWALVQLNDHGTAVTYLKKLADLEGESHQYRVWLAQSLARTARVPEAIQVLQPVCEQDDSPLDALLLQSELLEADNRASEAFRILEAIAPDHWDDPRFLMTYMHRGHAAGQDLLADEALKRLLELRQEGRVASEIIQDSTLEQLLEYGKSYRSRRESLQNAVTAGRMAWLFAEDVLGNPPSWAWVLHTQELKWLPEEPLDRAAFSIYATNGFTTQGSEQDRHLKEITAPVAGKEVVADITALLTLHNLELLEEVADFFGHIVLPATYGEMRVRDAHRFAQHQPSREEELKKIRIQIDRGRVEVVSENVPGLTHVSEYTDNPSSHLYRLKDILLPLRLSQKVTPQALEELSRVAHKPSAVDATHPALSLGDNLLVDLSTLRTLASQTVFETIATNFNIKVRAKDSEELGAELQAHDAARAAKQAHDALWTRVSSLAAC